MDVNQLARDRVQRARRITVMTGAGISADSGVPTFRGSDGLWNRYRAEDLATPEAFARDPELVWRWYDWRRGLISATTPNAAHHALVTLERRFHENFRLITQNVDGLHTRAGNQRVIEFHGNIWTLRCLGCGRITQDRRVPLPIPPRCNICNERLRPAVVWFGEAIGRDELEQGSAAASCCDLMLVIGTSGVVHPAAALAAIARRAGAGVIEINPIKSCAATDLWLAGRAATTLPPLVAPP